MKVYVGSRIPGPTLQQDGSRELQINKASGVRVGVYENGMRRGLPARQDIRNHSPDGFNWGYGGSGPAQLALALCVDALGEEIGSDAEVYQQFKEDFVARWGEQWSITSEEIIKWHKEHFPEAVIDKVATSMRLLLQEASGETIEDIETDPHGPGTEAWRQINHRRRHKTLHKMLDELLADFIWQTGKLASKSSVLELLEWSFKQTENPTDRSYGHSIDDPDVPL